MVVECNGREFHNRHAVPVKDLIIITVLWCGIIMSDESEQVDDNNSKFPLQYLRKPGSKNERKRDRIFIHLKSTNLKLWILENMPLYGHHAWDRNQIKWIVFGVFEDVLAALLTVSGRVRSCRL